MCVVMCYVKIEGDVSVSGTEELGNSPFISSDILIASMTQSGTNNDSGCRADDIAVTPIQGLHGRR